MMRGRPRVIRQPVENAGDSQAPDGPFRHDRHRFMRGVINDRQALDDPPFGAAVEHKVHGPDFIGDIGTHQRLALAHRYLLALTPAHLQTGPRCRVARHACG